MKELLFLVVWWFTILVPIPLYHRWYKISYYGTMAIILLYLGRGTIDAYYNVWFPLQTINRECSLHIGPDAQYMECGLLKPGETVRMIDKYKNWRKITGNTTGWVIQDCLEKIR